MPTLQEFLAGETLPYRGMRRTACEATYRVGVGVVIEYTEKGRQVRSLVDSVCDDKLATTLYYNLTRGDPPE